MSRFIGDHEGPELRLVQMLDADGGDLGQAQKLGGQDAAMTCDHVPLAVNNDRYEKPKRFDAFCYLADLFARMQPWVFRV